MSLTVTTNQPGANSDYSKYLYTDTQYPTKNQQINSSWLLDFSMVPFDSSFVQLNRGAYIRFNTATYPNWFTGYITSQPERVYVGTKAGVPTWIYNYEATSDDYILNLNTIGVLPLFIGVTMGYVISYLANLLAPGVFDTSNVSDGLLLASYNITPDKRFSDIIKDFTNSSNYIFWANNGKLFFKQQDFTKATVILDGNDPNFTPTNLNIRPALNQIVNDSVVVGDIAPEAYVDEYIVGDGFTGSFPLFTGVYGADKYILLNETFQGSSISTQNWTIFDNGNNWLQLYNGYLNILGGSNNNSYDISLQSLYPVLLEGTTRITHGEWDFIPQVLTNTVTGIIAGLWTLAPNSSYTGCLYGLQTAYTGGVFNIYSIVNGAVDFTKFITPDTSGASRYVLRTTMVCNRQHRFSQNQNYRDVNGVVNTISITPDTDTVNFLTTISEISVTTGLLTNSWFWENDNIALSSSALYATYIPIASNNVTATVSGITISLPVQASLDLLTLVTLDNLNFDTWNNTTSPASWTYCNSVVQETVDVVSGSACKLVGSSSSMVAKHITSATKANPCVLLSTAHGLTSGQSVTLLGFRQLGVGGGGWFTLNNTFVVTVIDANHFSVPINSTGFGTLQGTPEFTYTTNTGAAGVTVEIDKFFTAGVQYKMTAMVKPSASFTIGAIMFDISDIVGTVYGTGVSMVAGSFPNGSTAYSQISGTFTPSGGFTTTNLTTNAPLYLRVYLADQGTGFGTGFVVNGSSVLVDDLVIYQDWTTVMIGPNDIDDLLGDDTVATIESTNNLPQTITATGVPTYNPGASSLVFFKNTFLQTSTQPQPNQLYHLAYRAAGNCFGRVQNKVSIASEAVGWGDAGVRSEITTNLKPRPRNSKECQIAAGTIVGQDGYQHYTGSYQQVSTYLNNYFTGVITAATNATAALLTSTGYSLLSNTAIVITGFTGSWAVVNGQYQITAVSSSTFTIPHNTTSLGSMTGSPVFYGYQEPLAGSIVKFQNMSSYMPPVIAEEINSVSTQYISNKPFELFQHTFQFGEPDYVKKAVASFAAPQGSFQDYAVSQESDNQIVDISNIGLDTLPDVVDPLLTFWCSNSFTIDPNQTAPSGGGFEVRSSDVGWGCDAGNNLVTRSTGVFTVPRQNKTAAVFIKAYDTRNQLPYSEIFVPVTNALASNYTLFGSATATPKKLPGPNNKTFTIGQVVMPASGGAIGAATSSSCSMGQHVTVSFSLQPSTSALGQLLTYNLFVGSSVVTTEYITISNGWQRYTITGVAPSSGVVSINFGNGTTSAYTVNVTQLSVEFGVSIETVYCKTLATPYGALSKFPAVVRIAFPPINGPIGAYVDATLTLDTINTNIFISPPTQVINVTITSIIPCDALIKSISSTAAITLAAIPIVNVGQNGQYLTIINVGSFTITLPCVTTFSGSTIATPTDIVLSQNGVIDLLYLQGTGWVQASGSGASSTSDIINVNGILTYF